MDPGQKGFWKRIQKNVRQLVAPLSCALLFWVQWHDQVSRESAGRQGQGCTRSAWLQSVRSLCRRWQSELMSERCVVVTQLEGSKKCALGPGPKVRTSMFWGSVNSGEWAR